MVIRFFSLFILSSSLSLSFPSYSLPLPLFLIFMIIVDIIMLDCSSEAIFSLPWYNTDFDGISPPSYLLLFSGSSHEVLLNFFSLSGYLFILFSFFLFFSLIILFRFVDGYTTEIDNRRIYGILLLSYHQFNSFLWFFLLFIVRYIESGVPYLFGDGWIRDIENELVNGNCSVYFTSLDYYEGWYLLTGANDNGVVWILPFFIFFLILMSMKIFEGNGTYPIERDNKTIPCIYLSSLDISTSISEAISDMELASNWDALRVLQFQVLYFFLHLYVSSLFFILPPHSPSVFLFNLVFLRYSFFFYLSLIYSK